MDIVPILIIGAFALSGACFLAVFIICKRDDNFLNKIIKKEEYFSDERKFAEVLKNTPRFEHVNNAVDKESLDLCHKKNRDIQAQLIKQGAKVVIACGADPVINQGENERLTIIRPRAALFLKRTSGAAKVGIMPMASCSDISLLYVSKITKKFTTRENVSVAGHAIAGSIVGGSAGAMVGAINAANINASGGQEITTGIGYTYGLTDLMRITVDSIFISTDVIKDVGNPPPDFVVFRGKDYWILEDTYDGYYGNGMIGGNDDRKHDACFDYMKKVVAHYATSAQFKMKGAPSVLDLI